MSRIFNRFTLAIGVPALLALLGGAIAFAATDNGGPAASGKGWHHNSGAQEARHGSGDGSDCPFKDKGNSESEGASTSNET